MWIRFYDDGSDSEMTKNDTGSASLPKNKFAPVVTKYKKGEN